MDLRMLTIVIFFFYVWLSLQSHVSAFNMSKGGNNDDDNAAGDGMGLEGKHFCDGVLISRSRIPAPEDDDNDDEDCPDIKVSNTVPNFSLDAYAGLWYEIGSTASYKLQSEPGLACDQLLISKTKPNGGKVVRSSQRVVNDKTAAGVGAVSAAVGRACVATRRACVEVGHVARVSRQLMDITRYSSQLGTRLSTAAQGAQLALHRAAQHLNRLMSLAAQISQANCSDIRTAMHRFLDSSPATRLHGHLTNDLLNEVAYARSHLSQILLEHSPSLNNLTKGFLYNASLALQSISVSLVPRTVSIDLSLGSIPLATTSLFSNAQPITNGTVSSLSGNFTSASPSLPKLEVSINGTTSTQWILALDYNPHQKITSYSAALVYSCHELENGDISKSISILSRTPNLAQAIVAKFLAKAKLLNIYNDCEDPFVFTLQKGGNCGKQKTSL